MIEDDIENVRNIRVHWISEILLFIIAPNHFPLVEGLDYIIQKRNDEL